MSAAPKVSIVTPFYNPGRFIAEAVESVLAQTYEDWELLLVNDGSRDESTDIAHRYAAAYPERITYLEHPGRENRGMPATRRVGIARSRGEYIANLDSDDAWTPTKLAEQLAILEARPEVAMTFAPMRIWVSWDPARPGTDWTQQLTFPTDRTIQPPDFVPLLLTGRNDPQGYLIRRAAYEHIGGYENDVGICEDWALYVKIALKYPIYVAGKYNCYYRQHPGQSCILLQHSGRFYADFVPFFKWLRRYLAETGCDDAAVRRAAAAAVRRNRMDRLKEFSRRIARRLRNTSRAGERQAV